MIEFFNVLFKVSAAVAMGFMVLSILHGDTQHACLYGILCLLLRDGIKRGKA